jgi:TIR domain-containing protein
VADLSYDVFFSYANPDRRQAAALCKTLEANGLKAWIAPRDIPPGANWSNTIVQAIDQSRALIVIFSSAANQSRQIFREVDYADNRKLPLFLFRIEDLEPSGSLRYFVSSTQWVDAWSGPLKKHTGSLLRSVRGVLAHSSENPPDSPTAPTRSPTPLRVKVADKKSRRVVHNPYSEGWREKPRKIEKAIYAYEEWLCTVASVVEAD